METERLRKIYRDYGFREYRDHQYANWLVFTYERGYFHNAEIVSIGERAEPKELLEALTEDGYACRTQCYKSADDAEWNLFHGFFGANEVRGQLTALVEHFEYQQTRHLGARYRYIPGPYSKVGIPGEQDGDIVKDIADSFLSEGAGLIILEAPAGHGKTCTAYEVLNRLLEVAPNKVPLFTELARNRSARVFRHVLLNEIDQNYPSLPSSIVEEQIQKGRVPLLIDGFDELIDRAPQEENFDDVEAMLDTLAELLRRDARALITTRRTALFASKRFHEWARTVDANFKIDRYILRAPRLANWLGAERAHALVQSDFPISKVRNPVLLSYLNSLKDTEFANCCESPDHIAEEYMLRLLKREQTRQDLQMTPHEQKTVFTAIVRDMINSDYLAADMQHVRSVIKEGNADLITEVAERYSGKRALNEEQLVDKLLVHAFLDRPQTDEELLQFVNDFVIGYLVGTIALEEGDGEWIAPERLMDRAVEAFAAVADDKRTLFYDRLQMALELVPSQRALEWEIALRKGINKKYSGASFNNLVLSDLALPAKGQLLDCVFTDCEFREVTFTPSSMSRVGFVNCSTFGCKISDDELTEETAWVAGNARASRILKALALEEETAEDADANNQTLDHDMKQVLQQFWPETERRPVKNTILLKQLFRELEDIPNVRVDNAVERLCVLGLISIRGEIGLLVHEKRRGIEKLLGRR